MNETMFQEPDRAVIKYVTNPVGACGFALEAYANERSGVVAFSVDMNHLQFLLGYLTRAGLNVELMTSTTELETRARVLERFAAGLIDVLLLSAHAYEQGISLVTASRVVILDDKPGTTLSRNCEARVNRIGRKEKLTVNYLQRDE